MKKALFIVGPTSVGKTDLAFKLSSVVPSVLISADSVQVYKGADIISGKDKTFPTQLLDIVDPTGQFSVRNFVQLVRPIVKKAYDEQKIPIFVGGTGFYVDALFGKIDTINVSPDFKLRAELDKLTVKELQQKLKELNPVRFKKMNNSDINNKRRLNRAIEVAQAQGPTLGMSGYVFKQGEVLVIGLETSRADLKKRIVKRVEERLKAGAIDEAKRLFRDYGKLSSQLKTANGYKELFDYLTGKTTFEEAKERWVIVETTTAKNQMTWFRHNKNITWFDIGQKGFEEDVLRLLFKTFTRIVD